MNQGPPINHSAPETNSFSPVRFNPWLFALLSCFILLVIFATRLINDFDLGYHLKGGQWILENRCFPVNDTYTYTVNDRHYVDLHWMYQVPLNLLFRLGGYSLLSIANIILIFIVFSLTYLRLRHTGAPDWMCVLLLGAALIGCELRFRVRPEILSWILISLTLWVLELRANRGRNLLFLLPLTQLVWVNVEGIFIIGWGLMLFYLISGFFHDRHFDKKLLQYSGLAAAACLLNPYFIHGVAFPFKLLATIGTSNIFKQGIAEFQSSWTLAQHQPFVPDWTLWVYKFFSFFLLFLFLATFKKRRLHEFLLAACFFYLSTTAQRNISLFMLTCVPLAAVCWKDLKWGRLRKFQAAVFSRPVTAWVFAFFMLGLCLRTITGSYYVSERRFERFGLGLDEQQQPVKAAQFLVQNRLDGRILNHMNFGGWLDWKGPQKVFVDGRLEVMGEKFFSEYTASLKPEGLAPLLARYGIDIIFFNPNHASRWLIDLGKMPQWRPVYLDESSVIFLKKGYAPWVPPMDNERPLAERGIFPTIRQEAPTLLQMARPSAWRCFREDFYKPAKYSVGLNDLGAYYWYSMNFNSAEAVFLGNIRRTSGRYHDMYFNLGSIYFDAGRYVESRLCMQRVLSEVPGSIGARYILSKLPP